MSSKITIKKDEETGECFIDFEEIKHYFEDPTIVEYYSLEELDDGGFTIQFFDKDNNIVYPSK